MMRITRNIVIILFVLITLILLSFISYNVECFSGINDSIVENGCYDYLIGANPKILEMNLPSGISDDEKDKIIKNRMDVLANFTAMRTSTDSDLGTNYAYMDACTIDKSMIKSLFETADKTSIDTNLSKCIIDGKILTSNVIDKYGTLDTTNVKVVSKTLSDYIPNFQGNPMYTPNIVGNNVTDGCVFDFADSNYSTGQFINDLDTLSSMKNYSNLYTQNRIDASNTQNIMSLTESNLILTSNVTSLNGQVKNLNQTVNNLNGNIVTLSNEIDVFSAKLNDIQTNTVSLRNENNFNITSFQPRKALTVFQPANSSGKPVVEGYTNFFKKIENKAKNIIHKAENVAKNLEKKIENKITQKKPSNDWNTKYLATIGVDCDPNEVITQFQLNTTYNPPKAAYKYTCAKLGSENGNVEVSLQKEKTPANDSGSGKLVYLDRHQLKCSDKNAMLNQFKLKEVNGGKEIEYDYTCSTFQSPTPYKVLTGVSCYDASTPLNQGNDGTGFNYLDRHNVECADGYALSDLKLQRNNNGNQIQYQYKCCKPNFDWTTDPVLKKSLQY